MRIMVVIAVSLCGCGANQAGLKPKAAKAMSCEESELSTSQIREGYRGDDFGARVEVEGCGNRVEFEKKGPGEWVQVTEVESIKDD